MIFNTTVSDNGGSIYVRIPKHLAEYFKLIDKAKPMECMIEDIGDNKAKITFQKWQ